MDGFGATNVQNLELLTKILLGAQGQTNGRTDSLYINSQLHCQTKEHWQSVLRR